MGLPLGARKRLMVEVHGYPSPAPSPLPERTRVASPLASPASPFLLEQQRPASREEPRRVSVSPSGGPSTVAPTARTLFSPTESTPEAGFSNEVVDKRPFRDTHGSGPERSRSSGGESSSLNLQAFATAPSVSVSSLRASLRNKAVAQPAPRSVSPPPNRSSLRRRTTVSTVAAGGGGGDGGSSDESGIGGAGSSSTTASSSRHKARSPRMSPRPTGSGGVRAMSSTKQRSFRSTMSGSGDSFSGNLEGRRARAAAAQEAVKSAEATAAAAAAAEASAVKGLKQRRASGIPHKPTPGGVGSRLAAPGSRLRRPGNGGTGGFGNVSAAAAAAAAAADGGGGDDNAGGSVARSMESSGNSMAATSKTGIAGGGGGELGGRRSFLPRPSPRAGRSSIPRAGSKRL